MGTDKAAGSVTGRHDKSRTQEIACAWCGCYSRPASACEVCGSPIPAIYPFPIPPSLDQSPGDQRLEFPADDAPDEPTVAIVPEVAEAEEPGWNSDTSVVETPSDWSNGITVVEAESGWTGSTSVVEEEPDWGDDPPPVEAETATVEAFIELAWPTPPHPDPNVTEDGSRAPEAAEAEHEPVIASPPTPDRRDAPVQPPDHIADQAPADGPAALMEEAEPEPEVPLPDRIEGAVELVDGPDAERASDLQAAVHEPVVEVEAPTPDVQFEAHQAPRPEEEAEGDRAPFVSVEDTPESPGDDARGLASIWDSTPESVTQPSEELPPIDIDVPVPPLSSVLEPDEPPETAVPPIGTADTTLDLRDEHEMSDSALPSSPLETEPAMDPAVDSDVIPHVQDVPADEAPEIEAPKPARRFLWRRSRKESQPHQSEESIPLEQQVVELEPQTLEPETVVEAMVSEPESDEPVMVDSQTLEPETVVEPEAVESVVIDSQTLEPETVVEPQPEVVEPVALEPQVLEPEALIEHEAVPEPEVQVTADLSPELLDPAHDGSLDVGEGLDELEHRLEDPAAAPQGFDENRSSWWFRRRHRQPEPAMTSPIDSQSEKPLTSPDTGVPSPMEFEGQADEASALAAEGQSAPVLEESPPAEPVELAADPIVVEEEAAPEEPPLVPSMETMADHVEPTAEAPVEVVPPEAATIEAIAATSNDSLQAPVENDSLDVPTWLTDSIASAFPAPPAVSEEPLRAEDAGAEPGPALHVEQASAETDPPAIGAIPTEPHHDEEEEAIPTAALLEELRAQAAPEGPAATLSAPPPRNEHPTGVQERPGRVLPTVPEPLHEFDQGKGRKRFGLFKRPKKDERDDVGTTKSFASGSGQRSSSSQVSSPGPISAEGRSRPAGDTASRPGRPAEPEVRASRPDRPSPAASTDRAPDGNGQAPQVAKSEVKVPRQREGAKRGSQKRASARSSTPRTLRCSSCGEPSEQGLCQVCRDALAELQGLSLFEEN